MSAASPTRGLLIDAVGTLIRLREPPGAVYTRIAMRHGVEREQGDVAARLGEQRITPPPLDGVPLADVPGRERAAWREIVRGALGSVAADGPCFAELFDFYAGHAAWVVEEGAPKALLRARNQGFRVGVVSNMDSRLQGLVRELGLAPALDAIVLPSNTGLAKPDPRIFQVALERLGSAAGLALYIGDREKDCVAAARASGLRGLRYARGEASSDPTLLTDWRMLQAHLT